MDKLSQYKQSVSKYFWWIPPEAIASLPDRSIVEAVLNYGTEAEVKQLFDLLGISKVADIFYHHANKPRSNYLPLVKHFFQLYFNRHVPQHSHFRSN